MLAGKQDGSESRLRQLEFLLKESDAPRTVPHLSPDAPVTTLPMGVSPFVSKGSPAPSLQPSVCIVFQIELILFSIWSCFSWF